MLRDSDLHIKIPSSTKQEAKKYSVLDSRTLSGFVVQAIREKIKAMQAEENKNGV
jgi:hypothetical protein